MEYVLELNPNAVMRAFGQELNPESYAICKADMLIKGQDVSRIKLGNTLSNDQLSHDKFDYMLSNPPFGVDWKKIEQDIKDELEIFKKDLGTFTRFYEFMSQIVDYDDKELEKLSLFARNLRPMLRENIILDDEIDLSNIEMSHYRLSKLRQIDIELQANSTEHQLEPSNDVGSATAKDKKEDFLSSIIHRLNEVFVTDKLTDQDMINYANTIADKVYENNGVMSQIANNTREQAMLGDFPRAIDDAILGSHEAHREQMMQLLSDPSKAHVFGHLIFDMLANRGQMPLR